MAKPFMTFDTKELRANALLLRGMEQKARTQVNKQTLKVARPVWADAVRAASRTRAEQSVLAQDTGVRVRQWGVVLRAGNRALVFGPTSDLSKAVEFGANRFLVNDVQGRRGTFKRRTQRQFVSTRPKGPVYSAVAEVYPRLLSLWIQTTIRTFYEVIGKG